MYRCEYLLYRCHTCSSVRVSVLVVYRYQFLLYSCQYLLQCIGVSTCCTGVGGQIDFLRGAAFGYDGLGKPIIAMASLAENGESKIVPYLKEGTYICYETLLVQVLYFLVIGSRVFSVC